MNSFITVSVLITGNTLRKSQCFRTISETISFFSVSSKAIKRGRGRLLKNSLSTSAHEVHINILIIATVTYYTITDTTEKKDTEAASLIQSFNDIDNQELGEDNDTLIHQETARASNDIHGQPSEMLQERRDWHLFFFYVFNCS